MFLTLGTKGCLWKGLALLIFDSSSLFNSLGLSSSCLLSNLNACRPASNCLLIWLVSSQADRIHAQDRAMASRSPVSWLCTSSWIAFSCFCCMMVSLVSILCFLADGVVGTPLYFFMLLAKVFMLSSAGGSFSIWLGAILCVWVGVYLASFSTSAQLASEKR